ncbi:MAG TPA: hypothetical protein VEF89_18575, partial [Solirubrobacteraceae bacterium]|nr:hypothetical protein [Solirubrobacteraceae bacterium]
MVLGLVALLLGGAAAVVTVAGRRQTRLLETVELRFGPDVSEDAVWGVLGAMSGLPHHTLVLLELVADAEGIRHYLRAEHQTVEIVRAHLRGLLPGVRLETAEPATASWRAAARIRWGGRHPLLSSDRNPETAAALLGALSGLKQHERLLLRWTLRPARGPYLPERQSRSQAHHGGLLGWLWPEQSLDASHLRALRSKYAGPVLTGSAVIAVSAGSDGQCMSLMTRVLAVFRSRSGLRGLPLVRYRRFGEVQRFVERLPLRLGSRFSPAELMGLVGWPI